MLTNQTSDIKFKFDVSFGRIELFTSCRTTKDGGFAYGGYSKTFDGDGDLIKQTEWQPTLIARME